MKRKNTSKLVLGYSVGVFFLLSTGIYAKNSNSLTLSPSRTLSNIVYADNSVSEIDIPAIPNSKLVTEAILQKGIIDQQIESLKVDKKKVNRVKTYLANRGAPLASEADTLVKMAEKYGIDFRLVAAISIIESSGGKHCYRPYNAWGWGGSAAAYTFKSWDEAIETVSRGLSRYYASGATSPALIAPRYNPHTPNEWARKVQYVMDQI